MDISVVASGLGFVEGPVWAPDGTLWLTSITEACVFHIAVDGTILDRIDTGGGANGLTIDSSGALYVAQNGGIWGGKPGTEPGVQVIVDGKVHHVVRGLDAPNDLCFGPDGRLYVTDSRDESNPLDPLTARPGRLYVCESDGSNLEMILEGPRFINGVAFAPDGHAIYVTETTTPHRVWKIPFDAGIRNPSPLLELQGGFPDGLAMDVGGGLWIAATVDDSIQVYSPEGELRQRIQLPEGASPTNVCFGGADLSTLYITAAGLGQVLSIPTGIVGMPLFAGKV